MSAIQLLGISAAVVLIYMVALWITSLVIRDASIVDSFWGLGFVVCSAVYFIFAEGFVGRKILTVVLVALWGLRLSFYIFRRRSGKPEDPRYVAMRERRGRSFWWFSLFQVFLLQGLLMWVISHVLFAAQSGAEPARLVGWDIAGLAVWVIGFFFEAVGDFQLARFKADPTNRGKVMDRGLWRYTRHPNYFGEVTMWWGYFLIAVAAGGWWAFYGPIIMTLLILRVSGITLLEKRQSQIKPKYQEYIESTSAFFPWFPRRRRLPLD